MKNKVLIMLAMVLLCILSSCHSYDEDNAKTLIMARVPNCVSIVAVTENGGVHYAAVDSNYTIHTFYVTPHGGIEELTQKK